MSFNIWKQISKLAQEEDQKKQRQHAFAIAASRELGANAEITALEFHEGDVEAAAVAMGIDLDAEVESLKAKPAPAIPER